MRKKEPLSAVLFCCLKLLYDTVTTFEGGIVYVGDMVWLVEALMKLRRLGLLSEATPTDADRVRVAAEVAANDDLWAQVPAMLVDVPKEEAREVFRHFGAQHPSA